MLKTNMADEERKTTTPKELAQYEFAALAGKLYDGDKERRDLAARALRKFYDTCGVPRDDPIIGQALATGGFVPALQVYSNKYNQALAEMKLKDYLAYVEEKGYKLPETATRVAKLIEEAKELTIQEIRVGAKEKQELKVVATVLNELQDQVFEGNLYGKMIRASTDANIGGLESLLAQGEQQGH